MTESPLYTYAFLDANSNVIATALFASHDEDLINQTKITFAADSAVSCDECGVGSYFYNGDFYPPKPYTSWVIDEETTSWKAPIEYPTDGKTYKWDEESVSWESFIPDAPFPSWTWDPTSWGWIPPVASPDDGTSYYWNESEQKWEKAE